MATFSAIQHNGAVFKNESDEHRAGLSKLDNLAKAPGKVAEISGTPGYHIVIKWEDVRSEAKAMRWPVKSPSPEIPVGI